MKPLFKMLENCRGVEQMFIHHPEGDVFTHSLQTLYCGFRESNDTDLLLAAMLHDVGKKENSLGHEQIAIEWLEPFASVKTRWLIQHHMRVWTYLKGEMKRAKKCAGLVKHPWLPELIQLARWDKMGRNPNKKIIYDKKIITATFNKKAEFHFGTQQNMAR